MPVRRICVAVVLDGWSRLELWLGLGTRRSVNAERRLAIARMEDWLFALDGCLYRTRSLISAVDEALQGVL